MNFLETLESVGGVKPCQTCRQVYTPGYIVHDPDMELCRDCHGTGQILDLAPLLAKPWKLMDYVDGLVCALYESQERAPSGFEDWTRTLKDLHVVGPQRASNLVYEVARQLGGTAVVAESHEEITAENMAGVAQRKETWYRLSLSIPPDATVLFVTDTMDMEHESEFTGIADAVNGLNNVLPHLLCLVHNQGEEGPIVDARYTENGVTGTKCLEVISLHKTES